MTRSLRRIEKELPEQTYVDLVRSLFAPPVLSLIVTVLFVGVAGVAIAASGDIALTVLGLSGTIAAGAGLAVIFICRHRGTEGQVRDRATAIMAERRFAIPHIVFAVVLGLFGARVLALDQVGSHATIVALLVGYAAAIVATASLRPTICDASVTAAVLPTTLVCLWSARPFQASLGALLLVLLAALRHSVAGRYRAEVDRIGLRRTIARSARRDPLTGLVDRVGLAERFDAPMASHPGDRLVAIHCLGLARFAAINDRYGHLTGDALLRLVADRLAQNLRAGDVACRLGGATFAVMQRCARDVGEVEALAHRLVQRLEAPYRLGEQAVTLDISIGYAVSADGAALDDLLARAGNAFDAVKPIGSAGAGHGKRPIGTATARAA